ncbi:hypothetical protein [Noviherbaspirillum saxi]|uniref:Uncharacterized protein n=1 Tax=Noviherbaspirillum saxi TaxID=2320863 RepID=A0A3A3FRU4_9BURK|nr:hypothetical protein [Noviherbaspirillum saxi]RJF96182.1 hypothetical protein D3871_22940 [Noviherbaspirillum saxi]
MKKKPATRAGLNPIQEELEETVPIIVQCIINVCFSIVIADIQRSNMLEKENPRGTALRVSVSLVVLAWIFWYSGQILHRKFQKAEKDSLVN